MLHLKAFSGAVIDAIKIPLRTEGDFLMRRMPQIVT